MRASFILPPLKKVNVGGRVTTLDEAAKGWGCRRYMRAGDNKMKKTQPLRADRTGSHRAAYERNRKRVLAAQNTCGICGQPVDKSLKPPHSMAPCVDHIVPIAKGGHPSDIENLQLAHWSCNREKSDKLFKHINEPKVIGNRNLPQSMDWARYRAGK